MQPFYLAILGVIAAILLLLSRRRKEDNSSSLVENSLSDGERSIIVEGMTSGQLNHIVDSFMQLYQLDNFTRPQCEEQGNALVLTMSKEENLLSMCMWVNHIVYSDAKHKRLYKTVGWYPVGEAQYQEHPSSLSGKKVMLCRPPAGDSFDNVLVVSEDGQHFMQNLGSNLKPTESDVPYRHLEDYMKRYQTQQ